MAREWVWISAIAAGAAALYLPAANYGLILDDRPIVVENPVVREGDLAAALTRPWWPVPERVVQQAPNWRPLTTLTLHLQYAMLANVPPIPEPPPTLPFHLANILLYGGVVAALAPLARRLAGPGPPARLALLLFALHPAHVEAVVQVVGRADLLATLFSLLALTAYLRARETGRRDLAAAVPALYGLALASKESPFFLPLLLPAADVFLRGERLRDLLGPPLMRYVPCAVVAALFVLARPAVLGHAAFRVPELDTAPAVERVVSVARNASLSAGLLFAPVASHHIMTTLPSEAPFTTPLPRPFLGSLALVLLALGALAGWIPLARRRPVVSFCWLAAAVTWFPTSGILAIGAGVALRFLFLPSAFAACAVARGIEAAALRAGAGAGTVRAAAAAVLGIAGAVGTLVRVPEWEDDLTLHTAILKQEPRCYRSRAARGAALADRGRREEALSEFHEALRVNPEGIEARWNLAVALSRNPSGEKFGPGSDVAGARRALEEILERDRTRWDALYELALIEFHEKRLDACVARLRECLANGPPKDLAENVEKMLRDIAGQRGAEPRGQSGG
ncbi:MAG: tetratricopeptide repeat protein [Planctomycetales bacterium]|nr:tetratricopeptide repeat protein [Planctomycetales bacterium]